MDAVAAGQGGSTTTHRHKSLLLLLSSLQSPPPKPSPFLGGAAARSHERLHLAASGSPPRSDFDRSADEFRPSSSRPASQCRTPVLDLFVVSWFCRIAGIQQNLSTEQQYALDPLVLDLLQ